MKNPDDRWGAISQTLHWLIVALILVMAYLGLTMTDLPNTPYKIRVYALHKSIGLSILALVALRLLWRWYAGAPRELPGPGWQRRIAALTHAGLYLLLFAAPLSGWVVNSAAGFPLPWFGLMHLPPLVGLSLAHAAAAFWHHLFLRDATLARMLPRRWVRVPVSEDPTDA
jgi:cytochrome b561